MYLRTFGNFKSANPKKDWVRKLPIHKVSHLQKGCKPNKFCRFVFCGTFLKIAHLWNILISNREPAFHLV